ncbi:MAG: hypothetical protein WC653_04180 [Candidatus Gracilibacteria bacterium]
MSKFLSFLLCSMLLLNACGSEKDASTDAGTDESTFESSRETTVAGGSSELEDDTGYGFAYNASNVLDLDYSTSWCPTNEGVPQILTLSFPEVTILGPVGIVGGYARDEKIFFQNNRLKTVEVWYDDLPEAVDELHFDDTYGMQFFGLTQEEAQTIKFKIMEIYPGSKYTDTCVAEVDLWSDWVNQKDADAAYNYYLEYKEEFAKRPAGIADLDMIFADPSYAIYPEDITYECGAIDYTNITKDFSSDDSFTYVWKGYGDQTEYLGDYSPSSYGGDWSAWSRMTPILSAKLNTWAKAGDEFEVRWVQTPKLVKTGTVLAQACADGTLYISDVLETGGMGGYTLEVYYQGHLVGKTDLALSQ